LAVTSGQTAPADVKDVLFDPQDDGACTLTGLWISPRPQAGYIVKNTKDSPMPSSCVDHQPPKGWINRDCASQLRNGKCEERKRKKDGFCEATCGICTTTLPSQRANYWCVAWQRPFVKGVGFTVSIESGKIYAKATEARYYRWQETATSPERPNVDAMGNIINMPHLETAKLCSAESCSGYAVESLKGTIAAADALAAQKVDLSGGLAAGGVLNGTLALTAPSRSTADVMTMQEAHRRTRAAEISKLLPAATFLAASGGPVGLPTTSLRTFAPSRGASPIAVVFKPTTNSSRSSTSPSASSLLKLYEHLQHFNMPAQEHPSVNTSKDDTQPSLVP